MLPVNVSTYLARGGDKALIWKHTDAKWECKFYCLTQPERVTYSMVEYTQSINRIPKARGALVLLDR